MSVSIGSIAPPAPLPIARPRPFFSNTATSSCIPSSAGKNSSPYYPSTAESSIAESSITVSFSAATTAHLPYRADGHSLLCYLPYPVEPSAAEASIAASTTRWRPNTCENSFPCYPYLAESSTAESSAMVSSSSAAAAAHLPSRASKRSFIYYPPYHAETSAAESSAAAYAPATTLPWSYASENSPPSYYPSPAESSTAESSATVSPSSPAATAHLPSRAGERSFLYYPPCSIQEPSAAASVSAATTHVPPSAGENSPPCHPYPDFSYGYAQGWSMEDGNGYGYGQTWTEVLPETGDYKGYGCNPARSMEEVLVVVGLTGENINRELPPPLFEDYPSCSRYGHGDGWGGVEEAVAGIGGDNPLAGVFYGDFNGYSWSTMEEAGPVPSWPSAPPRLPLCRPYNWNLSDLSEPFTPATAVLPKHSLLKAEPSEPAATGKEKGPSELSLCLGLTPFSLEAEPKSDPCSSSSRGEKVCSGLSSEAVKKPNHGRDKACSDLSSGADKKWNHSREKASNSSVAEEEKASCGKEEEKEDRSSLHMGIVSEIEQVKLREEALNHTLSPGCAFDCSPILGDGTVHDEVGPKTLKEPTNTVVGCNTGKSEDIFLDSIILPDSIIVPESVIVPEKICLAKEERGLPSAFHLPASRHEMLAMSIYNLSQVLAEKQAAGLSGDTEVKYIESTICNLSYCLLELTKKGESARTKQDVKNQLITDSMDAEADSDLIDTQKVLDVNKDSIGNCPSVPSCKKDHVIKSSKERELKKVSMQDEGRLLEEITKLKTSFSELKDWILNEASENSAISDMYKKLCMDTEGSLALLRLEMIEAKQIIKDLKQTFMLMHKSAIGYQGSVEASEDSLHCSTCKREGCENEECKEATEIEGGEGGSNGENLRGVVVLEQGGEGRTRGRGDDGSVLEKEKSFLDTDEVWSRFGLLRARSIAPRKDDSTMGDLILVSGNDLEEDWVHL